MAPQNDDDINELSYGDSRDNENYHEEGAAFDKKHKKVIDDTSNLGPKLVDALKGRGADQDEQPPTKKMKTRNGAAKPTSINKRGISATVCDDVDDDDIMKLKKEGNVHYVPTSAMTGVESNITRLCAAISGQIYDASSIDDFNLNCGDLQIKCEIIMFDTHNKLEVTSPPFVVVVMGKTMICGWRGSSTLMDWIMDVAFAPVASSRWIKSAKSVRAQGGYCALIESDLSLHEDFLIKNIKDRGIEDLVMTGHSLAGGLAQVAHLSIAGSRANRYSPWSDRALKNLNVRSVAFSAPMTTLNLDRANDPVSVSFVNDVGSNMCNIIYECDPVPRFYANVSFIYALMENAIPQIAGGIPIPRMFRSMFGVQKKIANVLSSAIKSQGDLIKVAEYYRHIGKIIYYEDDQSKPVTYIDKGFHHTKPKGSTQNLFYDLKYKPSDDVIGTATTNHLFLVKGPGLAYGLKKPEEKKK
eukprot:scaffold64129_cov51-Attheya_sp.AAC.2